VIFLVVTMGRLDAEAKTTMSFLMRKGQSKSEVARLLGVTGGTVRYHAKRVAAKTVVAKSMR
jgi:DNA-binding CsgD family transcriptional regulator